MGLEISRGRKVAYAAMLLTLSVVLSRAVGLAQAGPLFAYNRFGFSVAIIMFSSVMLGPLYGMLIGVAGDALGWVLLGQWTGAFNVYLSVFYALIGVLPWLLFRLGRFAQGASIRKAICFFCVYTLALGTLLVLLWATKIFDDCFTIWRIDASIGKLVATIVLASVFLVGGGYSVFVYRKKKDGSFLFALWCALVIEIVTIFAKPLCFSLYCFTFLGTDIVSAWHISYQTLVLISCLFAFVDVPLNALLFRLLVWTSGKVLHN